MKIIEESWESGIPVNKTEITDFLSPALYSKSKVRSEQLSRSEQEVIYKEVTAMAWKYMRFLWECHPRDGDLAIFSCRYYLIYTPEQLEIALMSDTAKDLLIYGVLLTDQQIRSYALQEIDKQKREMEEGEGGGSESI